METQIWLFILTNKIPLVTLAFKLGPQVTIDFIEIMVRSYKREAVYNKGTNKKPNLILQYS